MQVVIRTKATPATVIGAARQVIHEIDPGLPIANVSTLATITDTAMACERFSMLLVASFGLLAEFLATVGVYGVIYYSVAQRTREIGLRIALGAQRAHIFSMIIRHAAGLSGIGILIGLFAALGIGESSADTFTQSALRTR